MPMDIARPVANIFHNKLAIAVDWFVHVDLPPQPPPLSAGTGVGDSAVSNKSEVLMVDTSTPISGSIAAGTVHIVKHCTRTIHHCFVPVASSTVVKPRRST